MSPESQRLEISFLQDKIAHWYNARPDFHDRMVSVVARWLRPAMDELNMSAEQLEHAIGTNSEAATLFTWLAEESFGCLYKGTTVFEEYLEDSARSDNGFYLRYLRRLANSKTTLWRVQKKPSSFGFIIAPASDIGPSHAISDRTFAKDVAKGDVLLTRLVDMPAGPVMGQALFNMGPIEERMADLSSARLQNLLSAFVHMTLQSPLGANGLGASACQTEPGCTSHESAGHETGRTDRTPDQAAEHGGQDRPAADGAQDNTGSGQQHSGPSDSPASDTSPTSPEREHLMERVRKLFAMAQQSDASPHEAEIALRRCQSLMAKYGITEADLHTSEFGNAEFTSGRTVPSHVKFLASAVASLHDVLFVTGEAGFAEFRGFDVDAKVAKLTLEYLIDAVERSLASRKRAGDFPAGRSAAYDYRLGFATQVYKRVEELVDERKRAEKAMAGTGTSLTVRKMAIVDQECGQDLRSSRSTSSRGARDATAHAAGLDDGSRVSLDQQVESTGAPLAIPKL